jgi:hypothetical protein
VCILARTQRNSPAFGAVPTTLVYAVAGKLKPEVPSLPNPASPEVKQAASQAVDAVKVGTCVELPQSTCSKEMQLSWSQHRALNHLQGKEASAVEAAAPTAPNAILLGLAAAGLVGAGDSSAAWVAHHVTVHAACAV